jgi:hypothetical protein
VDVLPPGWEDISAKGLVALFVVMTFLGWLIPKRWHERAMRDKDETIARQRRQLDEALETNARLTTAVQNLTVPAHTAATALRSIAREAGGDPDRLVDGDD